MNAEDPVTFPTAENPDACKGMSCLSDVCKEIDATVASNPYIAVGGAVLLGLIVGQCIGHAVNKALLPATDSEWYGR